MIISRFRVLLAEKATREQRTISMREVSREIDASMYTLGKLADNELREIPVDLLDELCQYLNVETGDLLVRVEDTAPEAQQFLKTTALVGAGA